MTTLRLCTCTPIFALSLLLGCTGETDPAAQPDSGVWDGAAAMDGQVDPDASPTLDARPGQDASAGSDANREPDPIIEPRFAADGFCGEADGEWAFCEDFDGRGADGPEPLDLTGTGLRFNTHGHLAMVGVSCEVSENCEPYFQGGAMLTNAEDEGFGWTAIRVEQPFDFAGREGHIRFATTFNTTGRMNLGIVLSPLATNSMPDNRRFREDQHDPTSRVLGAVNDSPTLLIKAFRTRDHGGRAVGDVQLWTDGFETQLLTENTPVVIGHDLSLLHDIDVFITRTHIRVLMDGEPFIDRDLDDIGFDRAYVYLASESYNAMKDMETPRTREANTELWDNIAFDGPALAPNSLTPAGVQDVIFRAQGMSSCTVRGVPAEGPPTHFYQSMWIGWTAPLPLGGAPVTSEDIECTELDGPRDRSVPQWGYVEIVQR